MSDRDLVDALFPAHLPEPKDWEERYPSRRLLPGAEVTRFAPSPTGSLHLGGIYTALLAQDLAHQSGGTYLVRIEDTDQAREVPGAVEEFDRVLSYFGLLPDEAGADGRWGPYRQSERESVYLSFVRDLVLRELAYPCFCDRGTLAAAAAEQRRSRAPVGYYGRWARCRALGAREIRERVLAGEPHVIRFRSPTAMARRIRFTDRVRGSVTMLDHTSDAIILKSASGGRRLPTYHFAHVVDDHLMRVTLVIRGEEWLTSVPLHRQLHAALGFDLPDYAHIASLLKIDGTSRRKLSKRKDPEAAAAFHRTAGYPAAAVRHYLLGLANSRLGELPTAKALTEPIRLSEAKTAGSVVDVAKLRSVSRDHIAALTPEEVVADVEKWAADHDTELLRVLREQRSVAIRAVELAQRGTGTPRKDIACWSEFRGRYGFCFRALYAPVTSPADARFEGLDPDLVIAVAGDFARDYVHADEPETWFDQIREVARRHGFAPDARSLRQAPRSFRGSVREIAGIIRVCLVGRGDSPDMFQIARLLGEREVLRRVTSVCGERLAIEAEPPRQGAVGR